MKGIITTMTAILFMANLASAQCIIDSVKMGPASGNDVFYSLANGSVKTEPNKNWHLAFSMSPSDSAAIWANHNAGNSFVKVFNIHKPFSQWSTVTLADTGATLCYNYDKGWSQGALNDLPRPSVFSFGWGTYDLVSHNVNGDSMFIVKADTAYYKVFVHQLLSTTMDYIISVENLNGGTTIMDTVSRGTAYTDRNFAYYNLATMTDLNREPSKTAWDIVFNRYNTLATLGTVTTQYPVIGALSNKGVKVSRVPMVHVDTAYAQYPAYTNPWPANSNIISNVGYDWKTPPAGPPPATWTIPDSLSYFIQDKPGNLYQLQFTGYSGSGSGTIYLGKRLVEPVAVNDVLSTIASYQYYPNPVQNDINIILNSKETSVANLVLTSLSGQILKSSSIKINQGLNNYVINIAALAKGNYLLSVKGNNININQTISVVK